MRKLTAYWELRGSGNIELLLDEVEELTLEGIRKWAYEGAELEVIEQGEWSINLRMPSDADLQAAIDQYKAENES